MKNTNIKLDTHINRLFSRIQVRGKVQGLEEVTRNDKLSSLRRFSQDTPYSPYHHVSMFEKLGQIQYTSVEKPRTVEKRSHMIGSLLKTVVPKELVVI